MINSPESANTSASEPPGAMDAGYAQAGSHLHDRRAFNAPVPLTTEKAMGVNVVLCTERGVPIAPTGDVALVLPSAAMDRALDQGSMLGFIDRYGNTMFNGQQCTVLSKELEALHNSLSSDDRHAVEIVIELARRCAASSHTYLWLIGD